MNFLYMSFSAGCIVLFTVLLRTLFKKKLPIELFCGLWWLGNAAGIGSVFDSVCLQRL